MTAIVTAMIGGCGLGVGDGDGPGGGVRRGVGLGGTDGLLVDGPPADAGSVRGVGTSIGLEPAGGCAVRPLAEASGVAVAGMAGVLEAGAAVGVG